MVHLIPRLGTELPPRPMIRWVLGALRMLAPRRVEEPQWMPMTVAVELVTMTELVAFIIGLTKAKVE